MFFFSHVFEYMLIGKYWAAFGNVSSRFLKFTWIFREIKPERNVVHGWLNTTANHVQN